MIEPATGMDPAVHGWLKAIGLDLEDLRDVDIHIAFNDVVTITCHRLAPRSMFKANPSVLKRARVINVIPTIARVALEPADRILVRCPQVLSAEASENIRVGVRKQFPGHEVIVLDGGMDLGVLSPDQAKEDHA